MTDSSMNKKKFPSLIRLPAERHPLGYLGLLGFLGVLGTVYGDPDLYDMYGLFSLFGLFWYRRKTKKADPNKGPGTTPGNPG